MSLHVVFLGTGGSVPTPNRGLPAILIQRKGEQILFDCGEGVQRQMIKSKGSFHKKTRIFVTHMHGDHVLGLPGLLQTMALLDRQKALEIYGPAGIGDFLECLKATVQFVLTFRIEVHELEKAGTVLDEEEYYVEAVKSSHVIPSFAYALVEKPRPGRFYPQKARKLGVPEGPLWSQLQKGMKVRLSKWQVIHPEDVSGSLRMGRKIVYTGDTRPSGVLARFAKRADLLIHDATLDDGLIDRAEEDGHSTPSQAAGTAIKANVKQLILTHISARYEDASLLLKQAKKVFRNVKVAEDFLEIEIALPES